MSMLRVLIADGHAVISEGMAAPLEGPYEIVGVASDGCALVEAAVQKHPDAVILDIELPSLKGSDAASLIKARLPYIAACLRAGANGYLPKTPPPGGLLLATRRVLSGETHIPGGIPAICVDASESAAQAIAASDLSPREYEVLQLVAEGRASKQIAHLLRISSRTVSFHRERIKQKLGLFTTAELTKYAVEHGLV
jgi:DNA-binding NarL/FixJ family response regulator